MKISRINKLVLGAALLCLGLISSASAVDIVGFSISSPKYQNLMSAGDFAGAPGARTNNWNNLLASSDGSGADIVLADGSVSNSAGNIINGMSVVFHPTSSGGGIYNRGSGTFTNDQKMYIDVDDAYGCSGFSQYGYIDITNIPYANYNIYCYFRPDNGSGSGNTRGGFWVITNTPSGSQRYYIQNQSNDVAQTQEPVPSNTGGNYVQTFTTSIPSGGAAWSSIQGGNYAVFSNLTNSWTRIWFAGLGNGSGAVDDLGNYVNGGSAAVRFKVAGFQIVQVPSGVATSLYLQNPNLTLRAGNPSGMQLTVLADLDTGATGVDKTTAPGIAYSVTDPNVATVSATGLLMPGTNGTANLIVSYQGISLTNPITVIGPTALSISVARTNLLYGGGQGDTTTATLYANFSDANNVVVNGYKFVSFGGTAGVVSANTNGVLTAVGVGTFSVTGNYAGASVTTNNVGVVTAYSAPGSVAALSVDITDSSSHGMAFHDLSGAPGARVSYWNNLVVPSSVNVTNQIVNPVDYHGNVLAGTVVQWIPNDPAGSHYAYTQGTLTTNESVMFGAIFDQGMNNGTSYNSQIVVSNVPFATYDAYFYFENDNSANGTNRPGQVTINGVTQYRINSMSYPAMPDNNGNGYVQAQTTGLPASVTDIPYGNYIKFSGLTDPDLNVTWGAVGQDYIGDAASVTRVRLAGFQLVKSLDGLTATNLYLQSAVPGLLPGSPATHSLLLLADFSDGTMGGNITALSGVNYSSSDANVFQVDANGVITSGQTPGTADLTITYQTNTLVVSVTNLAPTSVTVGALPNTVYLDGVLGVQPAKATLLATFPGHANVDISGFNSVSYVDQGAAAATLNADGSITANSQGKADLGASYLGTTYITPNAFTVSSINNSPVLKHLYTFTNTTQVIDSVGGANGTVYPPLGANQPITLDGSRAIFPGDGTYANCPYIALPSGLINQMGDVSIEMWCGRSQLNAWARYWSFGSTTKGTDPHNSGSKTSGIQMIDSYAGDGTPDFSGPDWGDWKNTFNFTNGAEYQVVTIIAPNSGMAYFYVNGVLITNAAPSAAFLSTSVNDTVDWLGVSLYADSPLAGWINQLAIYEGVLSPSQIASDYAAGQSVFLPPFTVSTNVVPVTFSVSTGNLNLGWPPDHKGWTLQVQTNTLSAGLGTNWVTVPGSTTVTNMSIPISTLNGSVFYRLTYQP